MKNFILRKVLFLLLIGSQWVPALMAAEKNDYIALVIELSGNAFVRRNSQPEFVPIKWGNYLYQGDVVRTSDSSHVMLLFSNGAMVNLSATSQLTIEQHFGLNPNVATTQQNEHQKVVPQFEQIQIAHAKSLKMQVIVAADGSLRLQPTERKFDPNIRDFNSDTLLISPRMTTIPTTEPVLKWHSPYQDAEYTVTLADTVQILWSYKTKKTEFKVPYPLEYGKIYLWSVTFQRNLKKVKGPIASKFQVIEQTQLEEYKQLLQKIPVLKEQNRSNSYYHFILAFTYLKFNLIEKAIPHFQTLARINPETPFPHEALCRLYWDQDLDDNAMREFQIWQKLLAQNSIVMN